jgi:acyl-CoA dehydrogenase
VRAQFHKSIVDFGGIQEALAKLGAYAYAAEALRLFTVTQVDHGVKSAVASAISKANTTEWCREILRLAMDIHGGKGICMGPHNYLAQNYMEAPISITVEGANILTRSLIIFGQGLVRCHPYVLAEMSAALGENSTKARAQFDAAFWGHVGLLMSNTLRSKVLGITRGYWTRAPKGPFKRVFQRISRFSAALATVADWSMLSLGNRLKREEMLSGRLADIFSLLCLKCHFEILRGGK